MKMKRIIGFFLAASMLASALTLTSCDLMDSITGGGDTGNKNQTYTLEAEYIDLSEVSGAGESSSQSGVNMIYGNGESDKSKGWSEGYFVGYTYVANLKLDFVFQSDADATATIVLRLGSELGNLMLTPDLFEVQLNGTTVPYASLTLEGGSDMETIQFHDLTINANAQIKAGENTLSLIVRDNKLVAGERVGGPCVDCVKITTTAGITWSPKTSNPSDRGSTDLD